MSENQNLVARWSGDKQADPINRLIGARNSLRDDGYNDKFLAKLDAGTAEIRALRERIDDLESRNASLADCINTELRSNNGDLDQIRTFDDDFREAVKCLVDRAKASEAFCFKSEVKTLRERLEKLSSFAHDMIGTGGDDWCGDRDGFDIQDIAVKHELIEECPVRPGDEDAAAEWDTKTLFYEVDWLAAANRTEADS